MRVLAFLALLLFIALPGGGFAQQTENAPANPSAAPNQSGHELIVDARLTKDGETIEKGMIWRIFADQPDGDGKMPLVATAKGGTASFTLPAASYLVHAGFGRAGATKRVTLNPGGSTESFVLDAGGLELGANTGDALIPASDLSFTIYDVEVDEDGEREMIAKNIPAERTIRLKTGTYHVVSKYGDINAYVRADLEVEAGKVTKAVLQHRGAKVTLKLVSEPGGNPVANTAWTVLTEQGQKVFDSFSVAPSLILAEGIYEASVRNGANTYIHSFEVKAGDHETVEVLLK